MSIELKKEDGNMYDNCLKWISNNLNFFDPRVERKYANNLLRIKSFTELLFLENMFFPESAFKPSIHKKIIEMSKEILTSLNLNNFILHEHGFISASAVAQEFGRNNNIDLSFEKNVLQGMVDDKFDLLTTRSAFRKIDVKYSLNKAQVCSNYASFSDLAKNTILGKDFNYMYTNEISTYSITHSIFYLTDMGRKNIKGFNTKQILNKIFNLIPVYELERNLDILSELIISSYFLNVLLNQVQEKMIKDAISFISNYQKKDGAIPAPGRIGDKYSCKEEEFFACYHTTMVTLGAIFLYEKSSGSLN